MARRARERAAWLAPGEVVVGVGGTASLRSDRPKKGDHRIHVAAETARGVLGLSLTLAKEQRDRGGEEEVAARLVLNLLAEVVELPGRLALPLLPGEQVQREEVSSAGTLADLFAGRVEAVCVEMDGRVHVPEQKPTALVAGSFNPQHEGHLALAALVGRWRSS
jgi:hypothetical protein